MQEVSKNEKSENLRDAPLSPSALRIYTSAQHDLSRRGDKSRSLATREIAKPVIKRVGGFKLLIWKFASCTRRARRRLAKRFSLFLGG